MAKTPGFKKWKIGDVTVTRILEMDTLVMPPEYMLKTTTGTVLKYDWLQSHYATPEGHLLSHIQAFVLEIGQLRIMVDPCIGNRKPRHGPAFFNMLNTPFLDHLGRAGFPPEMIDMVLCTHLHLDHVGWNTRLEDGKWIPTFPNARYVFSRIEFEHTKNDNRLEADETFSDSVQPIMDCGLGELVEFDHHIADEVWLEPSPGHTPGHCSIRISSDGHDGVITGDMIHHAIQACEPDICSTFCFDEDQARATRRDFLKKCSETGVLVLGTHFGDPTGVYVFPDGDGWKFEVAEVNDAGNVLGR